MTASRTLKCSLSSAVLCLMKVFITPAAILNVFCLSVCLSLWHLFGCFIFYTHWPVSPTPPTLSVPLYTHPSLTTSPLGFVILPPSPPFPILFTPPLFLPHCFLLLPSFPTCPFPPPSFLPCSHPFISTLSILTLYSFFCHPALAVHCDIPNPAPFKTFPISPAWPLFFPDENAGHVHGTQAGRDRSWPSGGIWWGMTVMNVNLCGWVLWPGVERVDLIS